MSRPDTQTLLFSGPAKALEAIKLLSDSGMIVSRMSIQTWGRRIAIRSGVPIAAFCLEEIRALGGEIVGDPAMADEGRGLLATT